MLELTDVLAAVIEKNSRFLICQRPRAKAHGGLWEFPGGKRQPFETDFEALKRELHEELRVELISILSLIVVTKDELSGLTVGFVRAEISGEPQPIEHEMLAWATFDELAALPLAPADAQIVRRLR